MNRILTILPATFWIFFCGCPPPPISILITGELPQSRLWSLSNEKGYYHVEAVYSALTLNDRLREYNFHEIGVYNFDESYNYYDSVLVTSDSLLCFATTGFRAYSIDSVKLINIYPKSIAEDLITRGSLAAAYCAGIIAFVELFHWETSESVRNIAIGAGVGVAFGTLSVFLNRFEESIVVNPPRETLN